MSFIKFDSDDDIDSLSTADFKSALDTYTLLLVNDSISSSSNSYISKQLKQNAY
jgi:hypothetical protein